MKRWYCIQIIKFPKLNYTQKNIVKKAVHIIKPHAESKPELMAADFLMATVFPLQL